MIFSRITCPEKSMHRKPEGLEVHAFCGTVDENFGLEVHAFFGTGDENIISICRSADN